MLSQSLGRYTARLIITLVVAGLAVAAWRLSDVLILLFAAVLLAIGLCAAARAISRYTGLSRSVALTGTLVVACGVLGGAIWVFGAMVAAQFDDVAQVAPAGLKLFMGWLDQQWYGRLLLHQVRSSAEASVSGASVVRAAGVATSMIAAVGRAVSYALVVLFVAIYLAAQPQRYRRLFIRMVPPRHRPLVSRLFDDSGKVLQRWLVGQTVVMLAIGILTGLGLWWLGIEAAAALGLMGGLLCFIPIVGAILAAVPATLVALTQGPFYAVSVVLMYVGVHFIEGNFITPLVQAEATSLPPVLAILSTVAFSLLFGPGGVLLAAPLTLLLLTAVESLYVQQVLGEAPAEGARADPPAAKLESDPRAPKRSWSWIAARIVSRYLVAVPATGLAAGAALWWLGRSDWAAMSFAAGTAPVLVSLLATSAINLWRGEIGLDILAALAMGGALVGGENLAGAVIAMMFAGGQALEGYAQGSAERDMTALLDRVAQTAQVRRGDAIETVPVEDLKPGDMLLIRSGEALPVDGRVRGSVALLDEAALTGESVPVRHELGAAVASGVTNAGSPFDLEATRTAADSTYAGIVNLVASARKSKAPMSRLADRYAVVFLAATIVLAGIAWIFAHDWHRALAVLVIATPCPLILAVPVAVVSGMSLCARRGILIKSARTLEALAKVRTLLIDKTGTLTKGSAALSEILSEDGTDHDGLLQTAASLAQASTHAMSVALVDAARARGLALAVPSDVVESAGEGLMGRVGERQVVLGHPRLVARVTSGGKISARAGAGNTSVALGVGGLFKGTLVFRDELRPEAQATLQAFRDQGVTRIVLVTGDRTQVAKEIVAALPVDLVLGDASPTDKVEAVRAERARGPTLMVGDGINDAPALALADVGVALGARGAASAAQAADVVVLVDRLDRVAEAIHIAQSTRVIALQSIVAGIGLSTLGMIVAAAGHLPPLLGALAQEVIDVAVVLNALRCLGQVHETGPLRGPSTAPASNDKAPGTRAIDTTAWS